MKLLFLSDGLSPFVTGGIQQHSAMLVKHLAPIVEHITLMYCGPINGEVPTENEVLKVIGNPSNVETVSLPFLDMGKIPGHYVQASKKYSGELLKKTPYPLADYDAIYAQGFSGYAFVGKHPNVVVNLHGLEMFQKSYSLKEWLGKLLLRPIARHILLNSNIAVSLGGKLTDIMVEVGVPKTRISVLPNGIEDRWIVEKPKLRTKGAEIQMIFIGRNEPRKGFNILQKALESVNTPVHLHLVGPWPEFQQGIHKISNHGEVKVREKVFELIDKCDVLVLPSLSEGMPTVILEAMARGKAIIATNVGAVSVLAEGVSPKVFSVIEPGDINALKNSIIDCQKTTLQTTESSTDVMSSVLNKAREVSWTQVAKSTRKTLGD